jgi:hypothetical protein
MPIPTYIYLPRDYSCLLILNHQIFTIIREVACAKSIYFKHVFQFVFLVEEQLVYGKLQIRPECT